MTEKRALITGSGKRLGAAMAIALAEDGYDVAIHYAGSRAGAEETADAIRDLGQTCVLVQADLLNKDAVNTLVPRAAEGLGGPLTLLVNNASIFEYDTLETFTQQSWDRHIGSNLHAPVFLSQAFAAQCPKGMRDTAGEPIAAGLIVNMIDQRVRKLAPTFFTYTLAKMGLWAFTQTAAQALGPDIRVNAIGPGPTLQGGRQTAEDFAQQREATILERGSNPEDMIRTLRFLIASPAITGQLFCVDGGQHLAWQTPDIIGVE